MKIRTLTAAAVTAFSAHSALAATSYIQLAPFSALTTTGASGSGSYIGTTIDGTTAYNSIGTTTLKQFTVTTGLGASPTSAQITSSAMIDAATGGTGSLSGIIRSANATTLQLPDTTFDSVYRVDKSTGAINTYVSKSTLQGSANAFNVFGSSIFSTGEALVYDNTSVAASGTGVGPRFRGTLNGTAYDVASVSSITAAAPGSSYTYGGFTVGPTDNTLLLIDNNSTAASRRILSYNISAGTASTLLNASDITSVTHGSTAAFLPTAFYYSTADSLAYFYDNTSKDILSFDPAAATPASTLQVVLTGTQLAAGPEGTNLVSYFTTYNGQIAWVNVNTSGAGIYAVPEPASLAVLALGSLALGRRRRT